MAYTSLRAAPPLSPPQHSKVPREQTTEQQHNRRQGRTREARAGLLRASRAIARLDKTRILNCFMHLGMLEAIEIRLEIVLGNFRCLSISNCGFPAPDETLLLRLRRRLLRLRWRRRLLRRRLVRPRRLARRLGPGSGSGEEADKLEHALRLQRLDPLARACSPGRCASLCESHLIFPSPSTFPDRLHRRIVRVCESAHQVAGRIHVDLAPVHSCGQAHSCAPDTGRQADWSRERTPRPPHGRAL